MAIACNPDLLIADEPTTALDVTVAAKILDLLAKLKQSLGMAMIFISHDLGIVRRIADTIHVMRNGEIVESGRRPRSSPIRGMTTRACCSRTCRARVVMPGGTHRCFCAR